MKRSRMKILAIDTSCDETSVAVTDGVGVLANIISSQVELHREWGGVVPGIAKRAHQERLNPCVNAALREASTSISKVDAIAVTCGPGLAVALEVGIAKAKELSQKHQKPLIAVNHMEGHLLSAFAKDTNGGGVGDPQFPALGLLVSGGHTELILMRGFGRYEIVGQTLDDAAGECFDKVAVMLGLSYPGGPVISRLAKEGDPNSIELPVPMRGSADLNFSFSGLKTACLYRIRKEEKPTDKFIRNFCASFERTVVEALLIKLAEAVKKHSPRMVLLGGGVAANRRLQGAIEAGTGRLGIPVYKPFSSSLLTDNAAMIGVCAYFRSQRGNFVKDISALDRLPRLSLG